jgi:hypothetical protein
VIKTRTENINIIIETAHYWPSSAVIVSTPQEQTAFTPVEAEPSNNAAERSATGWVRYLGVAVNIETCSVAISS